MKEMGCECTLCHGICFFCQQKAMDATRAMAVQEYHASASPVVKITDAEKLDRDKKWAATARIVETYSNALTDPDREEIVKHLMSSRHITRAVVDMLAAGAPSETIYRHLATLWPARVADRPPVTETPLSSGTCTLSEVAQSRFVAPTEADLSPSWAKKVEEAKARIKARIAAAGAGMLTKAPPPSTEDPRWDNIVSLSNAKPGQTVYFNGELRMDASYNALVGRPQLLAKKEGGLINYTMPPPSPVLYFNMESGLMSVAEPSIVPQPDDRYPHTCPRCGSRAYLGLSSIDCSSPGCL